MYNYRATVLHVVDGDTVDLTFDLGLRVYTKDRVRLFGINAPERGKPGGAEATAFLTDLLPVGTVVMVDTHKDTTEKYGRWLADITVESPTLGVVKVSDYMIANGHAVAWDGKGPRP
jgi:micrococcal nuclease